METFQISNLGSPTPASPGRPGSALLTRSLFFSGRGGRASARSKTTREPLFEIRESVAWFWVVGPEGRTRGATGRAIKPGARFFDSLDVNTAFVCYPGLAAGRWRER